jgi:hypothetical protein
MKRRDKATSQCGQNGRMSPANVYTHLSYSRGVAFQSANAMWSIAGGGLGTFIMFSQLSSSSPLSKAWWWRDESSLLSVSSSKLMASLANRFRWRMGEPAPSLPINKIINYELPPVFVFVIFQIK